MNKLKNTKKIFLIVLTIVIMFSASAVFAEGNKVKFTFKWQGGNNSGNCFSSAMMSYESIYEIMLISPAKEDGTGTLLIDIFPEDSKTTKALQLQAEGTIKSSTGKGTGSWSQKSDCYGTWTAEIIEPFSTWHPKENTMVNKEGLLGRYYVQLGEEIESRSIKVNLKNDESVVQENLNTEGGKSDKNTSVIMEDDELTEEDFEISNLEPNTYEMIKVDDNPDVMKFVDIYGEEQYTRDGKHYYESYGKAVKPGITGLVNSVKNVIGGFKNFFFKTKYKDKDKQLRNDISREVLKDFKSKKEKRLKEIHGKYVKAMIDATGLLGKYASVPAEQIIKFNNEALESDFAQGAEYYFKEREGGRSSDNIYDTPPEEIEYGVGALTHSKYPKAVLYTKYEEVYQKYKLAKELARK